MKINLSGFKKLSNLDKLLFSEAVILIVLDIIWFAFLKFDPTPIYNINGIVILNYLLIGLVRKKLPLAAALITGMSVLLTLMGFVLIKGFLAPY